MKGLNMPVGANNSGGAATVTGDAQDAKIISIALAGGENDNAFQQDITLGEGTVFKINDESERGAVVRKLRIIFDFFESQNRFKLLPETITWGRNSETQEMVLEFYYLNIESDEIRPFQRTY